MSLYIAPCPFCGSDHLEFRSKYITCKGCGADGPIAIEARELAPLIHAWNHRVPLTPEATTKLVAQRLTKE